MSTFFYFDSIKMQKTQKCYPENVIEVLGENGGREALVDLVIPLNGLFEGLAFEDVNNGGKRFAMDN